MDNGVLQFLEALKAQGVVRHIGLSTHTPALAREVLDTGLADMMMFSINPSYDYQHGEYANGSATERMALYRRCEAEGVGISVMKAFAGGQLLDARTSPFGQALTEYQCIQYALDKPGVLTVLPGVRDRADLEPGPGLSAGWGGGAGLLRHQLPHPQRRGGHLRLLQPLPALPRRPGRGPHQQVL